MTPVRTRGAGTVALVRRAPVPDFPDIHQIVLPTPWEVGAVQVYLIEGDPLTLIDTGVKTAASFQTLRAAFDELGHGLDEVERIILTHYHEDHLGQAETIRNAGAKLEVWAHAAEVPIIEGWTPERQEKLDETNTLLSEYGVPDELIERQTHGLRELLKNAPPVSAATSVERVLRDGDRIPFKGYDLRAIHAPGHTAGHLLLHEERSRVLISGDHIMGDAVPYTENYYVEGPPAPTDLLARRPRFSGLTRYLHSTRRLRRQSYSAILPAHGGVIERPDRYIEDALLFYDVRVQRIERGLRRLAAMGQEVTGWDLWKALFPNQDPVEEMRTRMLMVIGALDELEAQGICTTSRRSDGVLVHTHAPKS
jgi:glyoxylase-like metal-dependent hydrolase (beta-lactamase superfamily II)